MVGEEKAGNAPNYIQMRVIPRPEDNGEIEQNRSPFLGLGQETGRPALYSLHREP
jgi:hypothetical protein